MTKEEQDKITHNVIGSAMEVHGILGNGFQEVVYQRALSIEMKLHSGHHKKILITSLWVVFHTIKNR